MCLLEFRLFRFIASPYSSGDVVFWGSFIFCICSSHISPPPPTLSPQKMDYGVEIWYVDLVRVPGVRWNGVDFLALLQLPSSPTVQIYVIIIFHENHAEKHFFAMLLFYWTLKSFTQLDTDQHCYNSTSRLKLPADFIYVTVLVIMTLSRNSIVSKFGRVKGCWGGKNWKNRSF